MLQRSLRGGLPSTVTRRLSERTLAGSASEGPEDQVGWLPC